MGGLVMVTTSSRRGAVLILVLVLLFLLSSLALIFANLTGTGRRIARNYLDSVRSRLLARSGVAAAIDTLSADPFSDRILYLGDDEGQGRDTSLRNVPLEWAKHPSLQEKEASSVSIRRPNGQVRTVGISGRHS